ncbi:MAG: hypothetical protein Q9174_004935, partial [Haloplaca sp. 1 TL-2023]
VYLSFFSPVIATLTSFYAILTTLFILLLSPITALCSSWKPLKDQFHDLLSPPLRLQLRMVFSHLDTEPDALDKSEHSQRRSGNNTFLLIIVSIFSPAYAAAIAVTAWVAAGFWCTALILGDPDGRDKKDDGRAVVLGVKGLWERWLVRGLR